MLVIRRFKRLRSSLLFIFCEIDTLLENGSRTRNRPGNDISVEIRGPLVDIGSLAICTKIFAQKSIPELSYLFYQYLFLA